MRTDYVWANGLERQSNHWLSLAPRLLHRWKVLSEGDWWYMYIEKGGDKVWF